jgi:hypothetical protein
MFVAVIVLLLNGSPVFEGRAPQRFESRQSENGCDAWLQANVPTLAAAIHEQGLKYEIDADCAREM